MYISLLNKSVIFSSLFLLAGFSNSEESDNWRLTLPLGKVFVQETDSSYWSRGTVYQHLANNNKIKTEVKSRCELKNREKRVLRIGELSLVEINYNDQNENSIHTLKGRSWDESAKQARLEVAKELNLKLDKLLIDEMNNHFTSTSYWYEEEIDITLVGCRIKERWYDSSNQIYYTLVELKK